LERAVFQKHFLAAAAHARTFGQTFLLEELPSAMRFRVLLNQSYDGHADAGHRLYPEESGRRVDTDADGVVELLWRDHHVPEWIDISVVDEDGATTIFELLTCGRFSKNDATLYYTWGPVPPFGVKSPTFPAWVPIDHDQPPKFSIHDRSECSSLADLARKLRHRALVTWLTLRGHAFDDDAIDKLDFQRCKHLTLERTRIRCLAGLRGVSSLRGLSVTCAGAISFAKLPRLEHLEGITLDGAPRELTGVTQLMGAPKLNTLSLTAEQPIDAEPVQLSLTKLRLELTSLPRWLTTGPSLRDLTLHASNATDDDVWRFVSPCASELEYLSVGRTAVTNALLDRLDALPNLKFLGAEDTNITPEALADFAKRAHRVKRFRYFPRPVRSRTR
jgi:hypothetical protein